MQYLQNQINDAPNLGSRTWYLSRDIGQVSLGIYHGLQYSLNWLTDEYLFGIWESDNDL